MSVNQPVLLSEHQVPIKDSITHKESKTKQIHKPSWVVHKEELYWKLSSSFHIGMSHRICSNRHSFTFWFYKFLMQTLLNKSSDLNFFYLKIEIIVNAYGNCVISMEWFSNLIS